jgi:hypothetical protein
MTPFSGRGPGLNELQDLRSDFGIGADRADCLQKRRQVVHKFSRSNLGEEVSPAILDTCIRELDQSSVIHYPLYHRVANMQRQSSHIQCAQLCVWVLVADALLQRAHGLLWSDGLGANDIGDLEV